MSQAESQVFPCFHCRGTGRCRVCHGTGDLPFQRGKRCTSCFPKGSGMCQNCRGLGGRDEKGRPTAYGRAAAVVAAEYAATQAADPIVQRTAPQPAEPAAERKPSAAKPVKPVQPAKPAAAAPKAAAKSAPAARKKPAARSAAKSPSKAPKKGK